VYNSTDNAFMVSAADYCEIINPTVITAGGYGVYGVNTDYLDIKGGKIYNTTDEGIQLTTTNHCTVNGVSINSTAAGKEGIQLSASDYTMVSNNIVTNSGDDGIYVVAGSDYNIVSNNLIYKVTAGDVGIYCNGNSCIITGNNIKEGTGGGNHGLRIGGFDNIIVGNNCEDGGDVSDIRNLNTGNIIENNTGNVTYSDAAAKVMADGTLDVLGVTVFDTTNTQVDVTLEDGMYAGQQKMLVLATVDASNDDVILTITHHETSDPEVFTFDTVDEYLLLVWTGTEWATVSGTATP